MVSILHRNDSRSLAGKDSRQHLMDMLKLRAKLRQKLLVIFAQRRL